MPVITLDKNRFSRFVGQKLTLEEMTNWLPWLGFDIEAVEEDCVKAEFNPNRIDFCSYAGVARAFKGIRGWEVGLPKYDVQKGETVLRIQKPVFKVRPFMLAAVVRDVKFDEEDVVGIMEMQEDLHWGIGRDRRKASIGVHNLAVVNSPFTFTAVDPESVRFVPLDETDEMNLKQITEKHEKGITYRHLIDWAPKYPLLFDRNGKILSMPPIINGELTRIDEKTRDLFLDVTGTNYAAVEKSLNILSTALADMGGKIERVEVKYIDQVVFSPDLAPQKMKLRTQYVNKTLGLKLSESRIIECLEKSRLGPKRNGKSTLDVAIPAYRADIIHKIDLVEEVAIGYGYYNFKPTFPVSATIGKQHPACKKANIARQIMIGLGFTEVMNFTLTNEIQHYERMRRQVERSVKLTNPVSNEYTIVRRELLPGLMEVLSNNKHESFPQNLFEVSDVVWLKSGTETGCERRLHVAAVSSHATANFTEMKSAAEAMLENMDLKLWKMKAAENLSFIEGRAAVIIIKGNQIGIVGEVHPEVLDNFELENPTTAFEVDFEAFL